MTITSIIQDAETLILELREKLNTLKTLDHTTASDILLTRQEAADLLGKSIRQLDRDCERYNIPKEYVGGGVRIRKIHILKFMGVLPVADKPQSEFDRIRTRYGV